MKKITFLFTSDKDGFDRMAPMEVERRQAKKMLQELVEKGYYNVVAFDEENEIVPMSFEIGKVEHLGIKIKLFNDGKFYTVSVSYPSGVKETFESYSRRTATEKFTDFGKDLLTR